MVWNTVQDHHGYINVKSSDKRTVFEPYFPVTRNDVAVEKTEVLIKDYMGHGEEILVSVRPGQKAIIASGFSETDDVRMTQKLGAGKYMKKPYTLVKIGLAVKEELRK